MNSKKHLKKWPFHLATPCAVATLCLQSTVAQTAEKEGVLPPVSPLKVQNAVPHAVELFDLADVRLQESDFKKAMETDLNYLLKLDPKRQIRLWHPDFNEHGRSTKGVGTFEVLVDDQLIGTCKPDELPFNTFVDVSYPISAALTAGKSTVTLSLRAKKHVRGIYEVRILKD
jgi:hypothetical protein